MKNWHKINKANVHGWVVELNWPKALRMVTAFRFVQSFARAPLPWGGGREHPQAERRFRNTAAMHHIRAARGRLLRLTPLEALGNVLP